MNVLVVSNMGAKPSAPVQGQFVGNQVARLTELLSDVHYHYMAWNGDSVIHKLFKYPVFFLLFVTRFVFSSKKFDIIHVHYYFPTIICAWLYKMLRNSGVKIVVTCHGSDIYQFPTPFRLYKQLSQIVSHWFFTSEKLASRFYRKVENSSILSAGYDDKRYFPKQQAQYVHDFLFVGHLDNNKGIDRLIALIKAFPENTFAVVGSGALEKDIRVNASGNVIFYGKLAPHALVDLYRKSRVLLSLSRQESFGLVMTEAMACGVICLASETDGSSAQLPSEYIVSQKNETHFIADMSRKMASISSMPDIEYQQIQEIMINSSQQHSLTKVVDKIIAIYHQVLES